MFKTIETNKVYSQIIDQLKEGIKAGSIKMGDRLPSERDMAEMLGVSRTSVREAIRSLEMIGLVRCVHGEGNFISDNLEDSLSEPISLMFLLNKGNLEEINQIRRAIEIEAVMIATDKINSSSLEKLETYCNIIENEMDDNKKIEADKQFHYEIARASENILIINILNALSSLLDNFIGEMRMKIVIEKHIMDPHRSILEAIKKKNKEEARFQMTKHMDIIEASIVSNFDVIKNT